MNYVIHVIRNTDGELIKFNSLDRLIYDFINCQFWESAKKIKKLKLKKLKNYKQIKYKKVKNQYASYNKRKRDT